MQAINSKPFTTTSAEMGSFLEFKTGIIPHLTRERAGDLVKISFPGSDEIFQAALEYAAGCPESRLLNIRTRLYRRIREVQI